MTSTPVEVGTLIVVILKAKNLPNKRHIGKQDPYCSVKLNNETRRTRAIKRGGQHPEWDEEVRFTVMEDLEDELARTATAGTDDSPPPPPPKKEGKKKIKSGKKMQLMCYADDPREPDLIGETMVDLTEVLTKGETDEWFTLTNKEKYCGEVYLELTFWSNEKPPEKRTTPQASSFNPQYGGPGSFTPSTDSEIPASLKHGGSNHNTPSPSRIPSSSGPDATPPPSLRPSGSLAKISLYTAPYEQHGRYNDVDQLSNGLAELGVSSPSRRRESFPPVQAGPSEFGYAGSSTHGSYSTLSSSGSLSSIHSIGTHSPGGHPSQGHHRNSLSSVPEPFAQNDYSQRIPHSMAPVSEGYAPAHSYQFQHTSSGFVRPPPQSQTPAPSHFGVPPPTSHSMPSGFVPPQPTSSAMSFHTPPPQQQYPPPSQTPFQYPAYPQPPVSAPPVHQYGLSDMPVPPPSVPPGSHSAPPPQQMYHGTPSPPHPPQGLPPQNAYQQMQPGFPQPQSGSRPLPTPQVQHQQHNIEQSSSAFTSPPPGLPPSIVPGSVMFPNPATFQPPGPPPPPPPRRAPSLPPTPTKTPAITYPPPPPPPPPLQNGFHHPQVSHLTTPPPPPPPPPPSQFHGPNSSSPAHGHGPQSPPPQPHQSAQAYSSWAPPPPPPPPASGYSSPPHAPSPSNYPPPSSQQPYYSNAPSAQFPAGPVWGSPPQHNAPQHVAHGSQDGWYQ